MYLFSLSKKVVVGPAPAEANPFRRAVSVVPILRDWLPLPLVYEANPEAQYMTQESYCQMLCMALGSVSFLFDSIHKFNPLYQQSVKCQLLCPVRVNYLGRFFPY
jgi:hypothetical protein